MNAVPKAAIFTAWLGQWLSGAAGPDDVIDAVSADDDEPPRLVGGPESIVPDGGGLAQLFGALRAARVDRVRLVLPTPGDVSGMPAGAPGTQLAVDAGQAVVAESAGEARALLVPEIIDYGSTSEPGVRTEWHATALAGGRYAPLGAVTASEASRDLKECVLAVGSRLGDGDHRLAEWRQDAADSLRTPDDDLGLPYAGGRSLQLAGMAGRMLQLVESTRDHDQLAPALVPLDRAARRALIAAVSG
ncbi:hypothetical protein [Spelaeicoccus albus]|uniref:hypothetical protein n=1 Tax=Spelaeicoccus albus TaxID=1280376 RepID=UPI0015CA574C|nr:hypothetical protein [Spelaeicoccus albus]